MSQPSRDDSPTRTNKERKKAEHVWGIAKQVVYAIWSSRSTLQLLPYDFSAMKSEGLKYRFGNVVTKPAGFNLVVDWTDIHAKEPMVAMVGHLRHQLSEAKDDILACPEGHIRFLRADSIVCGAPFSEITLKYRYTDPIVVESGANPFVIKEKDFWPPQSNFQRTISESK